jgi:hypothetical protein
MWEEDAWRIFELKKDDIVWACSTHGEEEEEEEEEEGKEKEKKKNTQFWC